MAGRGLPNQQSSPRAMTAAASMVPGVGDAIGLLSDASGYLNDPKSLTPATGLLSLAALVPGIPGGRVFHGSRKRVTSIDPSLLQARDSGFLGRGFYAADSPGMTKGYGRVVSAFDVSDDAKVLHAAIRPEDAPDLAKRVRDWVYASGFEGASKKGKLAGLEEEADMVLKDHLSFQRAVDRYAESQGFDVVKYSPGEIVVKNPAVLTSSRKK
jgi:hypothetical protein